MKFKPTLTLWIFIGMIVGGIMGQYVYSNYGGEATQQTFCDNIKLLSDIFLRLIKMIIAPLVFSTLVVGIAKLGDFTTMGRVGLKTLGWFYFATIIALVLGLLLVNIFKPGHVLDLSSFAQKVSDVDATKAPTLKGFIEHLIPKSIFEAMANNEILSIVVFSLFFGVAVSVLGEKAKIIVHALEAVAEVMFKITGYVMYFAPLGVLGAIANVIAQNGVGILQGYFYLILVFYFGLAFFAFGILGSICFMLKIPFARLIAHVSQPMVIAFSTASSESAFPKTVEALEKYGCSKRIVSFVLPLGYSFNLDGSIMYMTFATAFIAQAYGIDLSVGQQITMMLILLVTSKGVAGVPRASLVVIAALLPQFNLPEQGLALLLGVDQILDMGRSATNVVGNSVASAVISKWEGELSLDKQHKG